MMSSDFHTKWEVDSDANVCIFMFFFFVFFYQVVETLPSQVADG